MQEEKMTETSKKEETGTATNNNKKLTLGKTHVAMLSVSATVLVFILAFSCYGCSYQPITPPNPDEVHDTFENLYNSTWELDTAMGVPILTEMYDLAVDQFVIGKKHEDNESASAEICFRGRPSMRVELAYKEGYGFTIVSGMHQFAVKLLYSASKDGKSETLTMIGNGSKTHCYYLKK